MAAEVDGSSSAADALLEKLKDSDTSHDDFMKLLQQKIAEMVSTDPCLRGLPPDVTVEELEDEIALEQGKAMKLYLRRYDDVVIRELPARAILDTTVRKPMYARCETLSAPALALAVLQGANVSELKRVIQRTINVKHKRDGGKQRISW